MEKIRLDVLLVENQMFESREKARAAIMAGRISVDGKKIDKAGTLVNKEAKVLKTGTDLPYVSRGGFKLEKAIQVFGLDLQDKIMLDVGASTGGFTDCALINRAKKVFAVDVGYGQLAWKLRSDPRVVCLERVNIRYLDADSLEDKVDLCTIDVSFISLSKVLPKVKEFLKSEAEVMALIKPQFEAGKDKIGKKGVVRDKSVHKEVIKNIIAYGSTIDLFLKNLSFSPITGPEGNIEFLALFTQHEEQVQEDLDGLIETVVEEAHVSLK